MTANSTILLELLLGYFNLNDLIDSFVLWNFKVKLLGNGRSYKSILGVSDLGRPLLQRHEGATEPRLWRAVFYIP